MNYILLFVSVIFFAINTVSLKLFQTKIQKNPASVRLFQAGTALVASVFSALFGGLILPEVSTFILAVAFGVLFFLTAYSTSRCFECGPMSLTAVIINMSLAVPIVYSFIFFKEAIIARRVVGLCLMLLSIILSGFSQSGKNKNEKKGGIVWLCIVLIGFFSNGFASVIQKENQFTAGKESASTFLSIGYLCAALLFLCLFFIENKGKFLSPKKDISSLPVFLFIMVFAGLGSIVGYTLLGDLSTKIDASILYPCLNGGLALVASLVSMLVFKEKPTFMKILSLIVGLSAIILLAM
ncbi:MAG: hypothetical protein E7633_09940 [Ruminococcaceae bacterium]|nr:hypothetical protein [Oscillospiraceae bacterium]